MPDRQAEAAALALIAARLVDIRRRCTHAQRCEDDPDAILDIQRRIDARSALLARVREKQGRLNALPGLPGLSLGRDAKQARRAIERGDYELVHEFDRAIEDAELPGDTRAFLDEERQKLSADL